jgi:hypothetical protein
MLTQLKTEKIDVQRKRYRMNKKQTLPAMHQNSH